MYFFKSTLILFLILEVSSVLIENNENEKEDTKLNQNALVYQKTILEKTEMPKLELVIDVKNLSQTRTKQKKNRKGGKVRRKKNGRMNGKRKLKINNLDAETRNILRNNEKVDLVRNRTIEILKNGVRILNTGDVERKNVAKVNETLLQKILSSASVTKPDLLISASGIYKLPIGGDIGLYSSKKITKPENQEYNLQLTQAKETTNTNKPEELKEYEYDYDIAKDWDNKKTNEYMDKSIEGNVDYDSMNIDYNIGATLEQLVNILQNLNESNCSNCSEQMLTDPCEKWLRCKTSLEYAFLGDNVLPACPCLYPSSIFYDDKIFDDNQQRYFRWRDASSEAERLDVYKPTAVYCIRSLLAQGSQGVAAQHCCYDRDLRLITRGSGAGTVNYVSPDVSKRLHDVIDILPWKLCKGDFTRYNMARNPNNENNCSVNPGNEQYQKQILISKYF